MTTFNELVVRLLGNPAVFAVTTIALLLGAARLGFRRGSRFARQAEEQRDRLRGVQGAVLGMLGLLLGFTFSMAVGHYDARRVLVVREANAVGTTWLRDGLLPAAQQAPVRDSCGVISTFA